MNNYNSWALLSIKLSIVVVFLGLTSCAVLDARDQSVIIENHIEVSGSVAIGDALVGDTYAVLLSDEGGFVRWVNEFKLGRDGRYKFYTQPGKYIVGAYVDQNGDKNYQHEEPADYVGRLDGNPVIYSPELREKIQVPSISITGPINPEGTRSIVTDLNKGMKNIGVTKNIDDPIFSEEYGALGMWRPLNFVNQIGGGLFVLDQVDENKIPIILIHGIGGTPADFRKVISSIDRDKFQPWLFYYPSGIRLDMASHFLLKAVNQLVAHHQLQKLYVLGHSMGGLVAHSFVKEYQMSGGGAEIAFVMTINTPLGGMESARDGLNRSPIVVPSWRDVAAGSDYIKTLEAWSWPNTIPYYLIFSYAAGKDSDGVVDLNSQIPNYVQKQVNKMYGYNTGHAEVLSDDQFLTDLNRLLLQD